MIETKADFDFYGIHVAVRTDESRFAEVLADLRADFAYFERTRPAIDPEPEALIEMTLASAPALNDKPGRPRFRWFRVRGCEVYGFGGARLCDYGDGITALSYNRGAKRKFRISGLDPTRIREVAYLAMLSAVGEELETRGYVRIHALGLQAGAEAGVFLMSSGLGKSSLAIELLRQDPKAALFTDEIVLIRSGHVYPFPIRIALKPECAAKLGLPKPERIFVRKLYGAKALYPIPRSAVASPCPLGFLGFGIASATPSIRPTLRGGAIRFRLAFTLIIGLGLPQMAEHLLRLPAIPRLVRIAFNRVKLAAGLLWSIPVFAFAVSPKPAENYGELSSLLRFRCRSTHPSADRSHSESWLPDM